MNIIKFEIEKLENLTFEINDLVNPKTKPD
jgi:hypothetical protein